MDECELCDAKFEPGGLSPVCNLCWNKMALERDRYKAVVDTGRKLARLLPRGLGERVLTHYDPEVIAFLKALDESESRCNCAETKLHGGESAKCDWCKRVC